MNYYIQLPNNEYVEVPQGVSEDEARARIMRDPRFRPIIDQAISEQSSMLPDLAGSFVRGVGSIPTAVGTLTGLVPGMQDNLVSRGLTSAGEYLSQRGTAMMSPGGQMQQRLFQAVMEEAENQGLADQAKIALREAISNPRMLANITAESIPSLVTAFAGGAAVRGAAMVGSRLAGRQLGAEGARRAAVAGAIGAESVLEGGGSAADVYKQIKELPEEELQKSPEYQGLLRNMSPDEARESLARSAARQAGLQTAAISGTIGAALPGVETMPFARATSAGVTRRILTGAGTEAVQEAGQEGGGAFSENIARQRAEIERELTAGVGSRATLGAVVGGITGGAFGGLRSSAPEVDRTEDVELRNALQAGHPEFQRVAAGEFVSSVLPVSQEEFAAASPEVQQRLLGIAQERDGGAKLVYSTLGVTRREFLQASPEQQRALVEQAKAVQAESQQPITTQAGSRAEAYQFEAGREAPATSPDAMQGETQADYFRRIAEERAREARQAERPQAPPASDMFRAARQTNVVEPGTYTDDYVYQEIKNLEEKELQKNPEYQKLLRNGLKPEDARESLARSAAKRTTAFTQTRATAKSPKAFSPIVEGYIRQKGLESPRTPISIPVLQQYLARTFPGKPIPINQLKEQLDRYVLNPQPGSGFILTKTESGSYVPVDANPITRDTGEVKRAPASKKESEKVATGERATPMGVPAAPPEGPGFALPADVKQTLEDLRRGVKPQQQSLVQFLRKAGGLNNTGYMAGEVSNILGSNKALPGLINNQPRTPIKNQNGKVVGYKGGLTLDRAREKLVEEGFLPEDADINDMLNAIREELSGGGVNFGLTEDFEGQERQRAAQQLERALDEVGVSARDSDEDIARALGFEVQSRPATEEDVEALDRERFGNVPPKPLGPAAEYSARGQPEQAPQTEQAAPKAFDYMAVINDRLNKIRAKGKQGEAIAAAIEKELRSGKYQPEQLYAAFKGGEVMAGILPSGANHEIRFVERILKGDVEAQGRRLPPENTASAGIIEISLSNNFLNMVQETGAHEAFHVLQDYYGQYDSAFKKLMGQSFKDGMTLDQVDSTIKRKLQTIRMPGSKQSYWDFLTSSLPGKIDSAREAEAYVFGSLHDAAKRGIPMTGLKPAFTRFVNMLTKFTRRMGNALRGDGFNSPDDVFGRVVEGDAGRFAGEAAPEFRGGEEFSSRLPATIEVDGVSRPTTNSEGRPIHPTEEGVRNFWRWFGDSKVVDEDGKPLVVYHGTDKRFTKVNLNKGTQGLFWFTSDRAAIEAGDVGAAGRGVIMDLYAKIESPANWKQYDQLSLGEFRSRGLDGAILPESDGTMTGFIIDRPNQIKSAVNNTGAFSPADARIQYSARTLPKVSSTYQSAIDKVTGTYGQEPDSLFRRALDGLTGARAKYTMLYGGDKPQRVKATDSLVMSSVNQFHAGHLADQLLKSKGRPDAAIIGRSWESANNNDARIAWMMNGSGYRFDKTRGVLVRDPKVKSIKDMFANKVPTDEAGQKRFQTYAVANLERDLRKRGKKGFLNLTDTEIASVIQESERSFPQWKEVIKDLNNWNNSLLQLLVDAGNIDQATKDKLMQVFYTPLYRKMEDDAYHNADMVVGPATAGTLKNPSDALKRREGGEEPIGDLFENIVRNADAIVKSALKNVAMENTAKGLEIAGLAERVPAKLDGAKNIMTLRRDGKDVHYRIDDPLMMIAISTAPMQIQNGFYKAMASISGFLRDMITLAPPFMLANLWRGKIVSYVQEGVPLWRSTWLGLRDALKQTSSMTSIGDVTGFGGYTWGQGSRDLVSELKRQVRLADGTASMLDRARSIVQGLRHVGEATEFAERVKVVDHLISKGMNPDDAAFQGYLLAPFSRRGMGTGFFGSTASFLAPIVPFLNAKIQGTYRLLENEKNLPKHKFIMQMMARGSVVTMFSMALAALASDDERWENEPVERKMLYDIFYVGDKTILLPRAFEVGTWFGAIPVMLFDAARKEHGGDLGKAFAFAITNTLGFSPIPASIAPLITVATNYDFFMGRELESAGMRSRPASERSQEDTSRVAEGVAYAINNSLGELPRGMRTELSPIQVQALLQGYLGTAGTMILSAVDGFLGWSGVTPGKPAGPLGDPNSPLGIATTLSGVRRFVKGDEEKVSRFVGDFYDLKREVTQWTTAMNDARLAGDMARANEIASERSDLFSLKKQVDKASRDVGEISRRMRAIQNNPNMDPQEKADALVPLRQRRNEITGRIMELAVDRGVR